MKTKFLKFIVVVVIALAAGLNIINEKEISMSDIALSNVEALAQSESGSNGKALAQKSNGDYCCATLAGNKCTSSPDC